MSDRYWKLVRMPVAGTVAKRIGLPQPVELQRGPGELRGRVLLGGAGRMAEQAARILAAIGADAATALDDPVREHAARAGLDAAVFNPEAPADQRFKALVFDATGAELVELHRFFHPTVRRVLPSGRVVVIGDGRRALEGFTRSLGKEIGRGSTVNLIQASEDANLDSALRFLLSPRSAYVSGQVVRVGPGADVPVAGRTALVTGASRGIGAAIADVLEREGATVVRLDLADADIELDITGPDAPEWIAGHFEDGLDILVHNAGITKDRTLAKMPEERWQSVMEVNLFAPQRITEALLPRLRDDGRIVCVSSLSAIAGNAGQTNYATSKAGLLDLVSDLELDRGITINAVAPGFIETQMTAAMPIGVRELGRRLNSLRQGGLPVDVAETVTWLAGSGLDRNVVRVCGQSLLGA
ncbi:MAG TPA: 3-oxoacyl-ACP reductase [Solirubrobacter sp.]|nr:3-oxoacyl-ACP reductase [Solirubrobacter sp.]